MCVFSNTPTLQASSQWLSILYIMATICNTAFAAGAVPEVALRQIMQKHELAPELRIATANAGVLTCALTAALGDTATAALTELLLLVPVVRVSDVPSGPWPDSDALVTLR